MTNATDKILEKVLKEMKKILKTAHATSCTPKNCGCGMDELTWKLAELISARDKRLVESLEKLKKKEDYEDQYPYEQRVIGYNIAINRAIQLLKEESK